MKSILKIIGVLFGGILSSCGAMPKHDTVAIKNEMKNFIETESGREFEFIDFHRNIHFGSSETNNYWGELHAKDDKRVIVSMIAKAEEPTVTILDPEKVKELYRKSQKQAITADACDKVVRKYFQPEMVQAKLWSEQENFHINIYLKEPLDQEKMGKEIYPKFKQMVEEIKQTVLNPQETYFTINLHLFENEFDESRVNHKIGTTMGSEPVGDYHFKYESSNDKPELIYQTRVGFESDLDVQYKKIIQKELNIADISNVLHDFQPNAFWFPEDIDENGIRMYQRYFASIWDAEKKEVIDRKFVKINVFNDKMEWYEVEKFPR